MLTLHSPQVVQQKALQWKKEGPVGFVPTMGCLHEGHVALVRRAQELAERVIVSIFVNPLQFGPEEDLDKYPRTLAQDEALLDELGVDLLFHPTEKELYTKHFSTGVKVGELSRHFCGASRPGHFDGVATVCLKLFEITQPDFAVFGEKDFQQLRVLQQMCYDFNLPLNVVPVPTVREASGLALSSRNRYLTEEQKELALRLPRALGAAAELAQGNPALTVGELLGRLRRELEGLEEDYLGIASEKNLAPVSEEVKIGEIPYPRTFAAVRLGATRLIDNVPLYLDVHEKNS